MEGQPPVSPSSVSDSSGGETAICMPKQEPGVTSQPDGYILSSEPSHSEESEPPVATHPHTNRLAGETSPYLLQHQHNPVDWHPWGPEALEKARREDKPIFLSIGYSACHWCHVMERESFESEEVARLLNADWVSIKVDREERPDLDEVYMLATQLMTRSGGWPMSVFLTPDRKPFYAGTYFPPDDRYGRPGFQHLLRQLADAWKNRRDDVIQAANRAALGLAQYASLQNESGAIGPDLVPDAIQ